MQRTGRFGEYGGQYVPETVMNAVQELEAVLTAEACRTSYRPLNLKEED